MSKRAPERAAYEKQWRLENLERCRANNKAWRAANALEIKAKKAAYYAANVEEIKASRRGKPRVLSPEATARREDRRLTKRTGFTTDSLREQVEAQGFACAICERDLKNLKRRDWHADHCHASGQPRGVLCGPCNMALGLFKDDVSRLRAAISYLQNPPAVLL